MAIKKKIAIIGSGMAGCFMALCLAKKGYFVEIYEERADIRKARSESGRSFNITLYYRGILALKKAGLWNEIKKISTLAVGNYAHYGENQVTYDKYDAHDTEVLYTVHRNKLNSKLLDIAEKRKNIKIHFNSRLVRIDKEKRTFVIQTASDKKMKKVSADMVVGADGVNSFVRSAIIEPQSEKNSRIQEDWGYKEVYITPQKADLLKLSSSATHTWPRKNSLLIAFPNSDKSLTLMINLPLKGKNSFAVLNTEKKVNNFVANNFSELLPISTEIVKSFTENPTGNFVTIKTAPWYFKDYIVLIGDAAHGVIPFFGQGVCAALDDCLTITNLMDVYKNDWEKMFSEFEKRRKIDMDTLSHLAKENFIELRDKSRSSFFILKEKTDTALNKAFPSIWLPSLYVLIAHGTLNYNKAYRLHRRQNRIARYLGLDLLILIATIPWLFYIKLKKVLISH